MLPARLGGEASVPRNLSEHRAIHCVRDESPLDELSNVL